MSPDHPPLLRKWAALPLLFMTVWPTDADLSAENESHSVQAFKRAWIGRLAIPEGGFGLDHYLFFAIRDEALQRHGVDHPWLVPTTAKLERADFFNDPDRLLFWGRLQILFVGLLLAALVFAWAKEMFGVAGGLIALALFCFDPNFIAHSSLITTDLGLAAFLFGAVYFFWRTCRQLTVANALATAAFSGAAIATKLSAVLIVPMLGALALARIVSGSEWNTKLPKWPKLSSFASRAAAVVIIGVITTVVGYVILWATYDFRFSAAADPAQTAQAESALLAGMDESYRTAFPNREPGHPPIEDYVRRAAAIRMLRSQWPEKTQGRSSRPRRKFRRRRSVPQFHSVGS